MFLAVPQRAPSFTWTLCNLHMFIYVFFLQKVWHTFLMNFHHYGAFSLFFFSPSFHTKIASWFFLWVFNTFIFACVDFLYQPTSYPWNHQKPIGFFNCSQTSFVSRAPICQKPIAFLTFRKHLWWLSRCGERLKLLLQNNLQTERGDGPQTPSFC